jgi:hypothetical protein
VWHEKAWGLTELLDYIPNKIQSWKPQPEEVIGLGRNCTVFDHARFFAYAEWRRLKFNDQDRLLTAVYEYSMNINLSFQVPMIDREVHCIARSISRWTARHMDAAGLREWHRDQGIKSGIVRQVKADAKTKIIMDFIADHAGMSKRKVAAALSMPESTVRLHLKKAAGPNAQQTISKAGKTAPGAQRTISGL